MIMEDLAAITTATTLVTQGVEKRRPSQTFQSVVRAQINTKRWKSGILDNASSHCKEMVSITVLSFCVKLAQTFALKICYCYHKT